MCRMSTPPHPYLSRMSTGQHQTRRRIFRQFPPLCLPALSCPRSRPPPRNNHTVALNHAVHLTHSSSGLYISTHTHTHTQHTHAHMHMHTHAHTRTHTHITYCGMACISRMQCSSADPAVSDNSFAARASCRIVIARMDFSLRRNVHGYTHIFTYTFMNTVG